MKLKEFFKQQREHKPTQMQKISIHNKISSKQEKASLIKKFSFVAKVSIYTVFIVFITLSFYITFFQEQQTQNLHYSTSETTESTNILTYSGNKKSKNIETEEKTKLTENEFLKLELTSWLISEITGPAEFKVNQENNQNFIEVISWNNFKFYEEKIVGENLMVKTPEYEIFTTEERVDFEITKEDNQKVINNKKEDIFISKDRIEGKDVLKISQEKIVLDEKLQQKSDNSDEEKLEEEYELSKQEKEKTLPEEDFKKVTSLINSRLFERNVKSLVTSYLNGNESVYQISYENMITRIDRIYEAFGFEKYSKISQIKGEAKQRTMDDLFVSLDQLVSRIEADYYIPESQKEKLKSFLAWSMILREKDFGTYKGKEVDFDSVFDKLNIASYRKTLSFNNN